MSNDAGASGSVRVRVVDAGVVVEGPAGSTRTAELSWDPGVEVYHLGERVAEGSCRVRAGDAVRVELQHDEARIDYEVDVQPDSMQATLTIKPVTGHQRRIADAEPSENLHLRVITDVIQPEPPTFEAALAAIRAAGVVHGIEDAGIHAALKTLRTAHTIAVGEEPTPGTHGRLEPIIDFAALRYVGVLRDAALMRIVPKVEGIPGTNVRGRDVPVKPVRDARVRAGAGALIDEARRLVIAACDGQPWFDGEKSVEVRTELVLGDIDVETGDVDFCGSVRVRGDVGEGRTVRARHALRVDGSVDRALLESGTELEISGAVMSSTIRAGGARAVAAALMKHIDFIPADLDDALLQTAELQAASVARGADIPYGLALQLVIERHHALVIRNLIAAASECAHAGETWAGARSDFTSAARVLQTAAIEQRVHADIVEIIETVQHHISRLVELVEEPADLTVSYMQSSEAESSGIVTLTGAGAVDCRIVAWGGIRSVSGKAVVRGGTLISHGPVDVNEIGTPSGAKMHVQLGQRAVLNSGLVRAGTLVTSSSHTHRFLADRTDVAITMADRGMDVQSFAA